MRRDHSQDAGRDGPPAGADDNERVGGTGTVARRTRPVKRMPGGRAKVRPDETAAPDTGSGGSPLLAAARHYVSLGLSVIPVGSNKKAAIKWGPYQKRQPTDKELVEWFADPPAGRGIAIVTGAISGLVVVDVDPDGEGHVAELGLDDERTPVQRTPRGQHYVFAHPGHHVKSPTNLGGLKGIDLRGDGGYIIAEPTVRGKSRYQWEVALGECELAPLPPPVVRLLDGEAKTDGGGEQPPDEIEPILEGQRNATLASLAGAIRRQGGSQQAILAALRAENSLRCRPPLPDGEVEGIARSIARYDPAPDLVTDDRLVTCTAEELLARTAELKWLWKPWIPLGHLTILAGEPGAGKSAVALWLAACVTRGLAWPDDSPNGFSARHVLIADSEGAQAIWAQRIRDWGLPTDLLHFPGADGFGRIMLDDERHLDGVRQVVVERGIPLVIIDSLRTAMGATQDENDSKIAALLTPWAEMCRDCEIALVIIHHFGKRRSGDGQEADLGRLRGSSAIAASGRSVLAIDQPDSDAGLKRLSVVKSNLALMPEPIGFAWDKHGLVFDDAPKPQRTETALDRAMAFLRAELEEKPLPCGAVVERARAAGIAKDTLYRAKERLQIESRSDPDDPSGKRRLWAWVRVGRVPSEGGKVVLRIYPAIDDDEEGVET